MRILGAVLGVIFSCSVFAAEEAPVAPAFKDGVHYQTLTSPLRTTSGRDQVEVAELFWYG